MELRFQHLLLIALGLSCSSAFAQEQESGKRLKLNNEFFELGASVGTLAIQDFNTEISLRASATFKASEDFFLQTNYLYANSSPSAYESRQGNYFSGADRTFSHYDLLVGYNIFQGELYPSEGKTTLSALYAVAGVGNVNFGGEENFATTIGIGYKLGVHRRLNIVFDFRDFIYESNLFDASRTTHNTQFSIGLGFTL